MVTPAAKRKAAGGLRKAHPASERRTCRLLGMHRSTARSRPDPERGDGPLADRLRELARRHPRYGYLTLHHMLKREGLAADPQAQAPRLLAAWPASPNQAAQEAVAASGSGWPCRPGRTSAGRSASCPTSWPAASRLRILNVVDDFSRMCVGQLVATSITGARLALFLDELGKAAAAPKAVVCDNGPELTSKAMRFWSERSGAALNFIQPGKPTQNAFVESFNGKFRDSCLNQHWFKGLADVRRIVDDWRHHYNHERPHSSLGYSTPTECAKQAA